MTLDEAAAEAQDRGVPMLVLSGLVASTATELKGARLYLTYDERGEKWAITLRRNEAPLEEFTRHSFAPDQIDEAITTYLMMGGQRDTR